MSLEVNIRKEMEAIVAEVDAALYSDGSTKAAFPHVNFLAGHPIEIVEKIKRKLENPDVTVKEGRFPAVLLFLDIRKTKGKDPGYQARISFNMAIIRDTKPEYTSEQRDQYNFEPYLIPIYEELLNQIKLSTAFTITKMDQIDHEMYERYFWGKTGLYGNTGNEYDDFIDAIELQNIELLVNYKQDCKPLSNI